MGSCCQSERDHGVSHTKVASSSPTSPLPDPQPLHTDAPIGTDFTVGEIRRSDTLGSTFGSEPLMRARRGSLVSSDGKKSNQLNYRRNSLAGSRLSAGLPLTRLVGPIESLYTLTRVVHKDLSCLVYLAKHLLTGQERVVKRMDKKFRQSQTRSNEAEERFYSETLLLQMLDHPNILKLYELYEDRKYFYLVSEALNGGYLLEDLRLKGKRSRLEQQAAKIMMQVMKALIYCHSRGVVHRNLRTESLILQSTASDDTAHVFITGFGSASLLSAKDKLAMKISSAFYFAPESLLYEPSEKADVWSCGVILHMLLCGYPPFNGPTEDAVLEQIASEQPVIFPQSMWDGASSEVINLLRGMLTKHPSARLTLAECINHAWMQANLKKQTQDPKPLIKALQHLKAFEAKNHLKRTILAFMAAHIDTQEETKSLRDAFSEMDTNGDGLLSKQELVEAYTRIMSMEEATYVAEKVMWCVDLNGDGYMDYSEFMLAAKNHQSLMTPINIRSIFLQLDSDNSGKISFAEFKAALNRQKLQADDQMWETIVKEVDRDGDRELSLKEFSKLMLAAVDMGAKPRWSLQ